MTIKKLQKNLVQWYLENKRPLPWRESRDPYFIWISEVMLQQTTVQAVIPFFLRFKQRFPTIGSLAQAPLADVLEMWAGLGYYSRARNLHKAAQEIVRLKAFPHRYQDLLPLPGFGDYTSRAVASIAFGEPVGVVDGNVIRVLSRLYGQGFQFWKQDDKKMLQQRSDELCQNADAATVNQALMELGATICTPQSPACTLCPWSAFCKARQQGLTTTLPLKKPKKNLRYIAIEMHLHFKKNQIALVENHNLPFLKKTLMPPLKITQLQKKPKQYQFAHSITHYKIFVTTKKIATRPTHKNLQWYPVHQITKINPTSLLLKALKAESLLPQS